MARQTFTREVIQIVRVKYTPLLKLRGLNTFARTARNCAEQAAARVLLPQIIPAGP
jgi:hypothetical protein